MCWNKWDCKWAASIKHEGKQKRKGTFHTEEEAARAFDDAARELRGGAAHGAKFSLNFPTEAEKQEAEKQEAAAAAAIEPAKPAPLLGSLDVQQLLATYGPMGGEPCGAGSDGDAPDDDGVREPAGPAPGRVGSSVQLVVPLGVHAPYSGAAPTGVLPPGEQLDALLLRAKEVAQRHTLEHAKRKRNRFGFGEPAEKMKATQKQLDA